MSDCSILAGIGAGDAKECALLVVDLAVRLSTLPELVIG